MSRLLLLVLTCCMLAAGCGSDSDEPAESDAPGACAGADCEGRDTVEPGEDTTDAPTDVAETDDRSEDDADVESEDDVDTDLVVAAVAAAWGIDEDQARCVVEELSLDDPTAIDPSAVDDPGKEICGTSLLELMANGG